MAVALPVDLQGVIIVVALVAGALRGGLGYWLQAPEDEKFAPKKLFKTMARYAVFNVVSVNLMAGVGDVLWTVNGVVIYTLTQLALELGFDVSKRK